MPLSLVGRDERASFYAAQAARFGAPVLVLGSADGAMALVLAARGHAVVAVEPSISLHDEAKAALKGVRSQVTLLNADPRSVRLAQTFPLVLAPRNALSIASRTGGIDAMLDTVRAHLTPDGAFVFDLQWLRDRPGLVGSMGRPLFVSHLRERSKRPIHRLQRADLSVPELADALDAAGLQATERFGDFAGRPWDDTDELHVVVAGVR